MSASPPEPKTFVGEVKSWGKSIGIALLIWIVLRSYLVEAFRIPSPSMENTLLVGDFLFVNKAVFGGQLEIPITGIHGLRVKGYEQPHHDELVIFRSVEDSTPNLIIVKRVIGQPGDTLQMVHDSLIRNGKRLDEPYVLRLDVSGSEDLYRLQMRKLQLPHYLGKDAEHYQPTSHDWGPIVVPADSFWVMGDNREESYDSRYWGFLPVGRIEGRPSLIYFSVAMDPFRIRWNRILRRPS